MPALTRRRDPDAQQETWQIYYETSASARSPRGPSRLEALYDKISREDILAHAYAQCRSNKGAPGVDGQDFADIEAYGVQRWGSGRPN
jgi:hypothetical protein